MIKKIEKFLQTDLTYLAQGGSWITANNIVSSFASFVLLIAFGYFLPKNSYGTYQYVLSIAGILTIPTLSGIDTSMVRAVATGHSGSMLTGFKSKIRWGMLGGLASLVLAFYYFLNNNITLGLSFVIVAAFVPFMDSFTLYGAYLSGKKMFKNSSVYSSIINIFRVISLLLGLILTNNVILIVLIYFASNTLLNSIFFMLVFKKYIPKNEPEDSATISYGKHLSLMGILGNIASQVDKMFLFQNIGSAELAIYTFATSPITRITTLMSPITTLAYPKFSETDPATLKRTLPRKIFHLFVISSLITGVYILLAPWIYKIVFPKYLDSVIYSQIFALSILFFPQKLLAVALTAYQQKRALYMINTVSPIIKIAFLLILLPIYGIWGAIITLLISRFINGTMSVYYFNKI